MTADLKPCPFCGMAPSRSYGGRSGNRIWCANERCQERPLIAAETWSGAASIWNPIAPTVSDPGPGTSGLRTPQPGEAPVSDAPATAWQPIETAPRTSMILAHSDGMVRLVIWESGQWVQVGATIEQGWFVPTHWMPLPAPPVEKEGAE